MKIILNLKTVKACATVAILAALLGGCSGSQQEDEQLATDDGNDSAAEAPEQSGGDEPTEAPAEAEAAPEEPAAAVEDSSAMTMAPDAGMGGMGGPTAATAAAPSPAPTATAGGDSGRVVRFVKEDGVDVYTEAKEGAASAGKLRQGDVVVVNLENGWGKVNEGMYIKVNKLSKKAVPRKRSKAQWMPPSP